MSRFRTVKSECSYNRVLLAVYWLSCEGATCWVTDAELAAEAGVSVQTLKRYLRSLETSGIIAIFRIGHGSIIPYQQIVLLDHPDARHYIELFGIELRGKLSPYSKQARQTIEDIRQGALNEPCPVETSQRITLRSV